MKGTQFTVEERKIITEALVFASCADVCAEWSKQDYNVMLELAKKLNDPVIKLDSVYLFEGGMFDDEKTVEDITTNFPNLPRTSNIID